MDGLESVWANLLSGDARRIMGAWDALSAPERQAVLDHLVRMRDEAGWQAAQRESAAQALALLTGPAGSLPNRSE